ILGDGQGATGAPPPKPGSAPLPSATAPANPRVHAATHASSLGQRRPERRPPAPLPSREIEASPVAGDGDFADVFVHVGRREGARAADFQRLLTERAGIDKADVRRIRVRERNAFVSVRREELVKAINALTGATIAGKVAAAEPARERVGEGDPDDGPAQGEQA